LPGKRLVEVKAAMMAARSLEISQLQHEVGGGAILVCYFGVLQSYTSSTEGARSLEIGLQRAAGCGHCCNLPTICQISLFRTVHYQH
jgi:hypothetical protein